MTFDGPDPTAVLRVAELYAAGLYERGLQEVDSALASSPDDVALLTLRAQLLLEVDREDLAIPTAQRAIALAPDYARAHRVLASALLQRGGSKKAPLEPALAAVRLDPTPDAYFVLTHAWAARHKYRQAKQTAEALAAAYPSSIYVPLAHAIAEMGRAGALHQRDWRVVILVILLTRGLAAIGLVLWWAFETIRGRPHLRRADAYLRTALQANPTDPVPRLLAAEVFRMRYRYTQAVDTAVTTGALDARLVSGAAIVGSIRGRTTTAIICASVAWLVGVAFIGDPTAVTIALSILWAGVLFAGVCWFRQSQAAALTPALRRSLNRQRSPLVALLCIGGVMAIPFQAEMADRDFDVAAVIGGALLAVAIGFVSLAVAFARSWRHDPARA